MKKNLYDIDKLFKAALDEQEEVPDPGVWDAIDKHLDKNKVADINQKYIQLKKVAAALLILLIAIGAFTFTTWNKHQELVKSNEFKKTDIQKKDTGIINYTKHEQQQTTLPENFNEDNALYNEGSNNTVEQPSEKRMKPIAPINIKENTAVQKTIAKKEKENPSSAGSNNIIIKKRTQQITIVKADIGEEGNDKNRIEAGQRIALPFINPATVKVRSAEKLSTKIIVGSYHLPDDLTAKLIPAKLAIIKSGSFLAATVFYSPNFSSNTIKEEKDDRRPGGPGDDRDRKKIKDAEQHQSSFTVGVLIDYNFNKHWGLQSGLSITNKTINIEPKTIYARQDNNGAVKYLFDCSSGYLLLSTKSGTAPAVGDSLKALASTNTLQYLSVPFAAMYHYSLHKIDFFATAGTVVNILTKGKIETEIHNGIAKEVNVNTKINGLKSNYLAGIVSIGAAFNITDRMALSFTPSYNFALTASTQKAAVKSFPNSVSLAAGLRFKL